MLRISGLGTTVTLNVTRPEDAANRTGADVAPTKFNDPMWTRARIDYRKNVLVAGWEQRIRGAQRALIETWGPNLKEASGGQQLACTIAAREGRKLLMLPIGITEALGVPFTPPELLAGDVTTRSYTPDPDQRFEADFAIYAMSQRLLAGLVKPTGSSTFRAPVQLGLSEGSDLYLDLIGPTRGIQKVINDRMAKPSVRDLMVSGEWGYYLDQYGLNPIPPTQDEITQPGGLKAYYARGGYLINFAATLGRVPVAVMHMQYPTGYVLCGGVPTPMTGVAGDLRYDVFVTIGPTYQIRLDRHERGATRTVLNALANFTAQIGKLWCSGVSSMIGSKLLADSCEDEQGKACTKGAPKCHCQPPSSRQTSAVGLWSTGMSELCGRYMNPNDPGITPGFVPPEVQTITNPPPPIGARTVPWWVLVASGLTVGAAVFQKRR